MIQSSIYYGEVLHSRNHPKKHSFKYKYRSLFNKNIYDFKLKKFNKFKFSFSSYDFHEDIISEKIIKWFERYIEKNSLKVDHISLDLLKTPNLFLKRSFNPVCFWFLRKNGKTISYIAEVTNTFKEKQVYYIQNQGKEIENLAKSNNLSYKYLKFDSLDTHENQFGHINVSINELKKTIN